MGLDGIKLVYSLHMVAKRNSSGQFVKGSVANPNGRAGLSRATPAQQSKRQDGWGNILSGVGTASLDRRMSTTFDADVVSDEQAIELMRGDDIAARLCEKLPKHALRPGFDCLIEGDKGMQTKVENRWADLEVPAALEQAGVYERSRGGSIILVGALDGQDLRRALNHDRVAKVTALNVFEPREYQPIYYYNDPLQPKFRKPAIYRVQPLSPGYDEGGGMRGSTPFEVHESRLIVMDGIQVSSDSRSRTEHQQGDSVLTRVWRVLRDFNGSWDAIGLIMQDYSQSIFKIKDLYKIVQNDDLTTFKNRIQALEMGRSLVRASIIDSEEEFERKATPLAGVADILDRMESRMAAAADMPVSVLFGRSAGGLNATGEGDRKQWHESVADYRNTQINPALRMLTRCLLSEAGKPGQEFTIKGRAIEELTDLETSELRKLDAETVKILIDTQVIYPEEATRSMFGGDVYTGEITIDWDERKKLDLEADNTLEREQATAELAALAKEGSKAQAAKPAPKSLPKGKDEKVIA